MTCTICLNKGPNVPEMFNDCVIECLEKIKAHYMVFKKQLSEKDLVISALKEKNKKLERNVTHELIDKDSGKKRRLEELVILTPETLVNKSLDDLNVAKNDEEEFEISYITESPVRYEAKEKVKREPMKSIDLEVNCDQLKNFPSFNNNPARRAREKNNVQSDKVNIECKKNANWISKENEISRSIGRFHNQFLTNPRHVKRNSKPPVLSLKTGKLRQTRLQLDVSKSIPSSGDTTFCEEVIEDSPNNDSTFKKSNTSRQWSLRCNKSKNDTVEELKIQQANGNLNTSSVVMLTPATQDIIFLDDSCESFNIESMDLLRDLMNPSDSHLTNLKRIESNRIKSLQKPVSEKTEDHANKSSDFEQQNLESSLMFDNNDPKEGNKKETNLNLKRSKATADENTILEPNKELKVPHLQVSKDKDQVNVKKQRLFNVDCTECQTYIKYLGNRLTDEEVERHIRNCSKHKKSTVLNHTPEGFWNPMIKPLDKSDPRNETLIDDRFINKAINKPYLL